MVLRYKIIVLFIIIFSLSSCVEEFKPDISEYQDFLVVEGLITNEDANFIIKLSRSGGIGGDGWINIERNAILTINDDLGNIYIPKEYMDGHFITILNEFTAEVGRSYYIHIETSDGEVYESEPSKMLPVPPIESVYKVYRKKVNDEGFMIRLDSHNQNDSCKYYRYDFEEVWEIFIKWTYPPVEKRHCWFTEESNQILIKSTEDLAENSIVGFPLTYVSANSTNKLGIKYCINAKQYSLNKEEYKFWSQLEQMNENIGGLYDPTPASIKGNVYCCSDSTKRALGYFSVSAVSTFRYFISNSDHDLEVFDPYDLCEETYDPYLIKYYILQSNPFKITVDTTCVDCTVEGTNKKPLYWDTSN